MAKTYNKMMIDVKEDITDIITAKQNDSSSRYLDVYLYDEGTPIDLTDHEVRIYMLKPDGTEIFNNGEITEPINGRCQFKLTTEAIGLYGTLLAEISIWFDNAEILTTQTFNIYITQSLRSDGSVESSNEYGALVILFQNLYQSIDLMTNMVQSFGTAGEVSQGLEITTFWQMMEALYGVNAAALSTSSVSEVLNRIGLNTDTSAEATLFGWLGKVKDIVSVDTPIFIQSSSRYGNIMQKNGDNIPIPKISDADKPSSTTAYTRAVTIGDNVYFCFITRVSSLYNVVLEWNTITNAVRYLSEVPASTSVLNQAMNIGDELFVCLSSTMSIDNNQNNNVYKYDFSSDLWVQITSISTPYCYGSFTDGEHIYFLLKGETNDEVKTQKYDLLNATLEELSFATFKNTHNLVSTHTLHFDYLPDGTVAIDGLNYSVYSSNTNTYEYHRILIIFNLKSQLFYILRMRNGSGSTIRAYPLLDKESGLIFTHNHNGTDHYIHCIQIRAGRVSATLNNKGSAYFSNTNNYTPIVVNGAFYMTTYITYNSSGGYLYVGSYITVPLLYAYLSAANIETIWLKKGTKVRGMTSCRYYTMSEIANIPADGIPLSHELYTIPEDGYYEIDVANVREIYGGAS